MNHFLLVFDRARGCLLSQTTYEDHRVALMARFEAERLHDDNPDVEVVVLAAESVEDLHRTHGRYFFTISELAARAAATLG